MRIDLHTHSSVSDGTDTPTRLVLKAQAAGLDVIALTDHDTLLGLDEAAEAGRRVGVKVLAGVEVSTQLRGAEVHLLGYGIGQHDEAFNEELARGRASREQRLPAMLARLAALGLPLDLSEVMAQRKSANVTVGRPHVADAMVARGYVANRDEAFAKYLDRTGPAYVPRSMVDLGRGIDLIHEAGGAAVLAHPGIREMAEALTGDVIAGLTSEHGLDGIEVDYPLHDASTRDLYHRIGARLGLVRTGGSDYHGSGKVDHPLGVATARESAYRELLRRIRSHGGLAPV